MMERKILKCIFLLGAASLFNGVQCDQLLLENVHDDLVMRRTIGCAAECLKNDSKNVLAGCYDRCSEKQISLLIPMTESKSNETIQLICRDADAFVIEVQTNIKLKSVNVNDTGELYVVKFHESENRFAPERIYVSDSAHVKIENLTVNTAYSVTVSIVNAMKEYRHLSDTLVVRTLPNRAYRPKTIPNESIGLSYFTIDDDPKLLNAYVNWAPADDMVCHYGMILYETMENTANQHAFQAFKISDSQKLYRFKISNLVLGSHYHLAIKGINTKDAAIEGMESAVTFSTPSCWEMHDFSTSLCTPQPLRNLTSTHWLVSKGVYNINVTWEPMQPEHQPIYYVVSILPHHSGMHDVPGDDAEEHSFDTVSLNVTGDKNYAYFHKIMLNSVDYTIQVEATSKGGSIVTHAQQSLKEIYKSYLDRHEESIVTINILATIFVVLFLALVFSWVWYRSLERKRDFEDQSGGWHEELSAFRQENKANDMEVRRSQIMLYETLGEGAFGIVRKGKLMPQYRIKYNWGLIGLRQLKTNENGLKQSIDVAVKMVKGDTGDGIRISAKVKEFLDEIKVMKSVVGQHENIVNIVGHCTTGNDYSQLMLLTEYCSEGNLLNYLRAFRRETSGGENSEIEYFEWQPNEVDGSNHMFMAENPGYDVFMPDEIEGAPNSDRRHNKSENKIAAKMLTSADLLNFAIQIASGMEFLANNKIVHRDLAARNVLVCADKTIKIADFGLSRNIFVDNDNIYTKRSDGRVPLKWLALESMTRQQYTVHSDVWSYGILLYEIVTLGESPYPDLLPKEDLKQFLKDGKRMSKPYNCGQELYGIMLECWNSESEKRPSFKVIAQHLKKLSSQSDPNDLVIVCN